MLLKKDAHAGDKLLDMMALPPVTIPPPSGEVELRGTDVGGIAVHIAARVLAAVLARSFLPTVRDLVVGSDITLDHGTHRLKGVEGTWQLFAVFDR